MSRRKQTQGTTGEAGSKGAQADRDEGQAAPSDAAPDDEFFPRHRFEEPALVFEPPRQRPPRDFSLLKDFGIVLFLVAAVAAGLFTWNTVGRATSAAFATHPPTPVPSSSGRPVPSGSPRAGVIAVVASPSPAPSEAVPTPTPKPTRAPVNVNIVAKPKAVFASEASKTWCAAAAVQIVLNINGPKPDTSTARQGVVHRTEVALTTRADSRNGGVGPLGMVATLNKLGKVDYKLKIYPNRTAALRDAARAISRTGHPVILLAWRGAHAWVMSGYRADADPMLFKDAKIKGTYILDPWYPRVSSIWGPSDPPGTYQNGSEMIRNYLPWRRPEGRYPGRDGKFLAIVPVKA